MDILNFSKTLIKNNIPAGALLVDFTMGNGNDTLFLCRHVYNGFVYAFDIQEKALENTEKKLLENKIKNYSLIRDSHSNILKYINAIDGGMFNLGYLPGGDKNITTRCETTLKAVMDGISILNKDGLIVINIYPGHEEGKKEGEMLLEHLSNLNNLDYDVLLHRLVNKTSLNSPFIIAVKRRR